MPNPLLYRLRLIEDPVPRSGPEQMAADELLLHSADISTLRFYRWQVPTVSFGYFQAWAEIEPHLCGRPAVRRWTGGGMVEHGQDLTYTIVLPACAKESSLKASQLYCQIHGAIANVLRRHGQEIIPAGKASSTQPSKACFDQPVEHDLLANGRKLAGAAQRRTRAGILHQGSLLPASHAPDFANDLAHELATTVEPGDYPFPWSDVRELAKQRYATRDWLEQR